MNVYIRTSNDTLPVQRDEIARDGDLGARVDEAMGSVTPIKRSGKDAAAGRD
jgi:hypothetical protein